MSFIDSFKKYDQYLVSEVEEGFFHVQFNNPKTLNAFAERTWRAYHEILQRLDEHESTKVILISSNVPKAFSSGLDLREALSSMKAVSSPKEKYDQLHQHIVDFQYCIATPARINTPTVALANGISFGLALDIIAACSIRVAVADCKFSIREIKIGLTADMGSLQRIPRLIGNMSKVNELALTGSIFSAEDALQLGLVSKICPDLKSGVEYCKELCSEIIEGEKWALQGTKKCLQDMVDGKLAEEGFKWVADYNAKNIQGIPKL